jgi:protein-S-isoprenylcysteine O-methyltransferase Ste14
VLLPLVVVVGVPYLLRSAFDANNSPWEDGSPIGWLSRLAGAVLLVAGAALFIWCISLFVRVGQGTLAPWDPTKKLVTIGPYRFVRNPMISGVAFLLIGQTLFWPSKTVALWALVFITINHIYFVVSEEPGLEKRFGEPYRKYKANVPRWVPRLTPWTGD